MSWSEETERAEEVAVEETAAPEADPIADADVVEEAEAAEAVEGDLAELEKKAAERDEYLALAQRTQADFENYRKRMVRDVRAAEGRGMGRLAKELLPALDNLERAVAALEAADEEHHMTDGIRLVTTELAAALGRTGIENYAVKGERFDPVFHEAVGQHAVEGFERGTILEVLQPGYRLHDSILRPARVIVAG